MSNANRRSTLAAFGIEIEDTDAEMVQCPNCGQPIPENQRADHYRTDCPDVDTGVQYD
jgi:predicted RNA-binding Zn-ribbon protein involved in translation (DUF1610 family)